MASVPIGRLDLGQLAALESLQVTLLSDGDRASADLLLEGELVRGGAYVYSLDLHAGLQYRFGTAELARPTADHVILVERATGDIVWGSATALQGFGFDPQRASELSSEALTVDAQGSYRLILWSLPGQPGEAPVTERFQIEARADAPAFGGNAVFRFFDPQHQIQRLTASVEVRDQLLLERPDMRYDGEVFYGSDEPGEGLIPVFEVLDYTTGARFYTADQAARDALIESSASRVDQGAVIFVPDEAALDTVPVHTLANLDTGALFLTSSVNERLWLLLQGDWADEGVAFNVLTAPRAEPPVEPAPESAPEAPVIGVAGESAAEFS